MVEAAGEPGPAGQAHFIREVGDLLYHLLVMLAHKNCNLFDVEAELARRFGVSGLEEKAARKQPADDAESNSNSKVAAKPVKKTAKKKVAKTVATPIKKARRKTRL